ncbi:MAG TPA: glycosyl hydrolase family 8, partial [Polyangiaceae bacterium]|nr:glycosyl hydrolase family 8 [Polyangiaceae bacterium]
MLALGTLACIGGDELRAKASRDAQIQAANAPDAASEALPAEWKPKREPAWGEARANRGTQDLFTELLGKTETEVDEKVGTAVHRFFGIDTNEPAQLIRDSGYRLYYQLPQDPSMAFIWAADSNDVRSEGMSYGMMLAVQMNLQPEFDRLWKFARTYMQYPSDTSLSAWRSYFRWQGSVRAESPQNWSVKFGPETTPAPDGETYFAAALYLADRRWGSSGDVDYRNEAAKITWAMLHNRPHRDGRFPVINGRSNMVVFVPYQSSNDHSDPSYHLPAFYEIFAEYGPAEDADRWRELAKISRDFLVQSAHPKTGLHPDYATFTGAPTKGYQSSRHDEFYYDAWRVPMNMALDQDWFKADPRMKAQVEKYHAFFAGYMGDHNVTSALFEIDGSDPSGGGSTALTATLASGALVSDAPTRKALVENLWYVDQQSGQYRYYQECVYLLGLLATAGR